ncbi:MAG: hypothetical protein IJ944_02120 [Clostridia bacterium]|nr:hypothetical protein [Clostridia bacterium]
MRCTFFGHKDCPKDVEKQLQMVIIDLIENKKVRNFFVGNQGRFDFFVRKTLFLLSKKYPIKYTVVLAYMPREQENFDEYVGNTLYPNDIENVPKKFAISFRNRWMIENSEYVVTFVKYSWGGASQFKELAEKKRKIVINITTEKL